MGDSAVTIATTRVASFPGLPCFYLPFAFTIIHVTATGTEAKSYMLFLSPFFIMYSCACTCMRSKVYSNDLVTSIKFFFCVDLHILSLMHTGLSESLCRDGADAQYMQYLSKSV